MSPLLALRLFFEESYALRFASTQAGFAGLVGRSEVLIRAIEKGRSKMSRKFARKLSLLLGVDEEWLMKYPVTGKGIPAAGGGKITHEDVIRTLNVDDIGPVFANPNPKPVVEVVHQPLIEGILGMVRAEIADFHENPKEHGSDPTVEILDWLKKRAEGRSILRYFDLPDRGSQPPADAETPDS